MSKLSLLAGLLLMLAIPAFSQVAKRPDTGVDPVKPVVKSQAAARTAAAPAALTVVNGPGSTRSVILDASFDSYSLARIGPDGKLVFDCVSGSDAAAKQLKAPVTKAAPKKEQLDEK